MTLSELPLLLRCSLLKKFPKLKECVNVQIEVVHLEGKKIGEPNVRLVVKSEGKAFIDYNRLNLSHLKFEGISKAQRRVGFLVNYINDRYDLGVTIHDIEIDNDIVKSKKNSLVVQGAAKLQ